MALKKKFRTQFDPSSRVFINSGNREVIEYVEGSDGRAVPSGTKDLYDEIQSHRESVELSVLLQRYEAGDETALNKLSGTYIDVTSFPTTLAEAFERVRLAQESFNELPDDFKKLFGNDPNTFAMEYGSAEYNKKIEKYKKKVEKDLAANKPKSDPEPSGGANNE